jgi:hypothetical protein
MQYDQRIASTSALTGRSPEAVEQARMDGPPAAWRPLGDTSVFLPIDGAAPAQVSWTPGDAPTRQGRCVAR